MQPLWRYSWSVTSEGKVSTNTWKYLDLVLHRNSYNFFSKGVFTKIFSTLTYRLTPEIMQLSRGLKAPYSRKSCAVSRRKRNLTNFFISYFSAWKRKKYTLKTFSYSKPNQDTPKNKDGYPSEDVNTHPVWFWWTKTAAKRHQHRMKKEEWTYRTSNTQCAAPTGPVHKNTPKPLQHRFVIENDAAPKPI